MNCFESSDAGRFQMTPSGDLLYQIVRILFALSLLGFLLMVIRASMRELQLPMRSIVQDMTLQQRAELLTVPGEDGSQIPEGLVFEIQGVTTLGRARTAKVILDDTSVSAQHALIRPGTDRWTIEDLGSRNGTLVDGRKIEGPRELDCGASIQLGRVRLRLMC